MKTLVLRNPHRSNLRTDTLIVELQNGQSYAIDLTGLLGRSDLQKEIGHPLRQTLQLYAFYISALCIAAIVLSFTWKWWCFLSIPAIYWVLQRNATQYLAETLVANLSNSYRHLPMLFEHGLLWRVPITNGCEGEGEAVEPPLTMHQLLRETTVTYEIVPAAADGIPLAEASDELLDLVQRRLDAAHASAKRMSAEARSKK